MCLSDIHCSRCPRSWSAAGSPNLCTNLKLRVHQLDNICSSHRFRFGCRIDDATGRSLAKKYPKMARFGTPCIWPRSGANLKTKPYTDELQILSSLCMQRHDFATAVKGATPDQLRDRVGCAYLIYTVQGVRAAGLQLAPLIYARI